MDQVSQNTDLIHYMLAAISVLAGVCVTLWLDGKKQRSTQISQTKEFVRATEQMTAALNRNSGTIEANSRMINDSSRDIRDTIHQLFGDNYLPPKHRR